MTKKLKKPVSEWSEDEIDAFLEKLMRPVIRGMTCRVKQILDCAAEFEDEDEDEKSEAERKAELYESALRNIQVYLNDDFLKFLTGPYKPLLNKIRQTVDSALQENQ